MAKTVATIVDTPEFEVAMSIRSRVDDALCLWEQGRREGALLSALLAVAATSRRRFPKPMRDGEAFERFLEAAHRVRLNVEFRGEIHSIERVLYKWVRCELVHEGGLPMDVEFMRGEGDALSVRAGGAPDFVLKLSESWFHHFVHSVTSAPENAALFPV